MLKVELKPLIPESVIRRVTILCNQHSAVNLAQAFPDYDADPEVKELAVNAIQEGYNQYTHTWGHPELRASIARYYQRIHGVQLDPDANILVTCGCMEALRLIISTIVRCSAGKGNILIPEPYYESFPAQTLLEGGNPLFVSAADDGGYDIDGIINSIKTSKDVIALIICSPNNPSGQVIMENNLLRIAKACDEKHIVLICDETYERIVYDDSFTSLLALGGIRDNIIVVSGFGKAFSITGWRIGYLIAGRNIVEAIRPAHDYNTVCAPAPFQMAAVKLLDFPDEYKLKKIIEYKKRRDFTIGFLSNFGFKCRMPEGAYYVLADRTGIESEFTSSEDFVMHYLIKKCGVGGVPGNSFFSHAPHNDKWIRFTFSKQYKTLEEAAKRFSKVKH